MKASDVGAFFRKKAGGADHRKHVVDDDMRLVIRPGRRFDELVHLLEETGHRSEATGEERRTSAINCIDYGVLPLQGFVDPHDI